MNMSGHWIHARNSTENCVLGDMFLPDHIWFGSDNKNYMGIYTMFLNNQFVGEGMAKGGLPFKVSGSPAKDVGFDDIIDLYQTIEVIDTLTISY